MRNCPKRVSLMFAVGMCTSVAFAAGKREEEVHPKTIIEVKSIPSKPIYTFNRSLSPGRLVKAMQGKDGKIVTTYEVKVVDGKSVKHLVKSERIEPQPTVFHMGKAGWPTSRSGFSRGEVLTMKASAYDPSPKSNGKYARAGLTKLGVRTRFGAVAVDPKRIPLGTLLFVEGYGFGYACDIGSAIKGNRIDLFMNSRRACLQFGRRNVRVHILKSR